MATLVLGATGFVGSALVPALVQAGEDVRAASRHPRRENSSGNGSGSTRWVACDLERPETLAPALEGIDTVY
jgi:uncharacterized protein YbjT (DUF2867 family)